MIKRHNFKKMEDKVKEQIKEVKKTKGEVSLRFFEEKLIGSAYFTALATHSKKGYPYNCYSCMESQIDIMHSFIALNRISYQNGFHFKPSCTPRRIEHMIKFADFIAAAGRKIDEYILNQYKRFQYIDYKSAEKELNIAFCISRRDKPKKTKSL